MAPSLTGTRPAHERRVRRRQNTYAAIPSRRLDGATLVNEYDTVPCLTKRGTVMRRHSKVIVSVVVAVLCVGFEVTAASANRLSSSSGRIRAVWAALNLRNTGSGTVNVVCPVTIEGSFHSATMRKVRGALVGNVSRATTVSGACTNGRVTIAQEHLPWHVRYAGFTGTLPRLSGVALDLVNARFVAENGSSICDTGVSAAQPGRAIVLVETSGRVTGLRVDETSVIPLEGEIACFFAGEGAFAGTASVTGLGSTTSITITLI
jgi:hypothetical protein